MRRLKVVTAGEDNQFVAAHVGKLALVCPIPTRLLIHRVLGQEVENRKAIRVADVPELCGIFSKPVGFVSDGLVAIIPAGYLTHLLAFGCGVAVALGFPVPQSRGPADQARG